MKRGMVIELDKSIIFFDIDGTILSHRTLEISDSTKDAIKKLQDNGHLAFVNTGRTLGEIGQDILSLNFDGYVYGCGTHIIYKGEEFHHVSIPVETMPELIKDLRELHIEAILEGSKAIYYAEEYTNETAKMIKHDQTYLLNYNVLTWDEEIIDIDKLCIWPQVKSDFETFYNKYKEVFDFIDRGDEFYEVVPIGYSKATGIEFLLKHLNISLDNSYAIGDSSNDLTMLEYAKTSIAMENSSQDILDMASFITKDVDEGGVEHALKHYKLI